MPRPGWAADNSKTRVSQSCFKENRYPGLRPLYPTEAALDRAPQGASALCCSSAPRSGGSLSGAGFGAPIFCRAAQLPMSDECITLSPTKTRQTEGPAGPTDLRPEQKLVNEHRRAIQKSKMEAAAVLGGVAVVLAGALGARKIVNRS